jgi:hypothetical protein
MCEPDFLGAWAGYHRLAGITVRCGSSLDHLVRAGEDRSLKGLVILAGIAEKPDDLGKFCL